MLKYSGMQNIDSEHLAHDAVFEKEQRLLDAYFYKQH